MTPASFSIVDAHLDLAFNAVGMGADLRLPLEQLRSTPFGLDAAARAETPLVTVPELAAGGVDLVFGTIFVQSPRSGFGLVGPSYDSPAEARAQGVAQLLYYHQLAADNALRLVRDRHELAAEKSEIGLVLLMEGADPLRDPDDLQWWYTQGLRIVGPAWSGTRYSGGTHAPGPLTALGRDLVHEMSQQGVALDTSHLAELSFWQALDLHTGPLLASHSNCRALIPTDRHLSDDMIRAIVERDGVIGIVLGNAFLLHDLDGNPRKADVTMDVVRRHIEHICDLAGDTRHIGIGSDFDGGFGVEGVPAGIESCADLGLIAEALLDAGWPDSDVRNLMGDNWRRWLAFALPES